MTSASTATISLFKSIKSKASLELLEPCLRLNLGRTEGRVTGSGSKTGGSGSGSDVGGSGSEVGSITGESPLPLGVPTGSPKSPELASADGS